MIDNPPPRPRRRKIVTWIIRVVYAVVLMATIDSWSGFYYRHGVFSITLAKIRDGGTTASVGLGYCMTFLAENGRHGFGAGDLVLGCAVYR